jgi:tRNA (cytosine38-C5)-methyltransferase
VFNQYLQAHTRGDEDALGILRPLQLRYFTPTEVLRMLCFQRVGHGVPEESFRWPQDVATRTKYRLIGNSVNVAVVTELLNYLFL